MPKNQVHVGAISIENHLRFGIAFKNPRYEIEKFESVITDHLSYALHLFPSISTVEHFIWN